MADFETEKGRKLLQNGLKALKKSNNIRLGIVQNGKDGPISLLIDSILNRLSSTAAKQTLNKLLLAEEELEETFLNNEKDKKMKKLLEKIGGHGINMDQILTELNGQKGRKRLKMQWEFAKRKLELANGQMAIMANGIVYGPLEEDEQFEMEDFGLIEKLAERKGAKKVAKFVEEWKKEVSKLNLKY